MRLHIRSALALLLIAALLVPLCGCGGKTGKTEASKTEYTENNSFQIAAPDEGEGVTLSAPENVPETAEDIPEAKEPEPEAAQPLPDASDTPPDAAPSLESPAPAAASESTPSFAMPSGDAAPISQGTMPKQLTIEDVQAMNGDSTVIDIYSNKGYLSLLVGKYYDKPVENAEDGVESIKGMASLLGLTKGCEFFVVYSERDDDGYTYYTYQQRCGGYTLLYSTLRVVVDPDGYTAGLSCSFVPNLGITEDKGNITAQQAEDVVRKAQPASLRYYSDKTVRLAATFNNVVYNCWVVYTNNPDQSNGFDMPYIEHFVTTEGKYLTAIPANSFAESNSDVMNNDAYFSGLKVQQLTKNVRLGDGSTKKLTVPVSRNNADGKYYLMDPERKIAVAKYQDFCYRDELVFVSSTTLDGWSDNNLLAYSNYIKAYDFYASHGIRSIDGFGTPILVTVGYCDEQGNAVDNACFYGVNAGWACFAASDINHYSDCLDVVGHEFTHGVTRQSMQGTCYRNETGAINEAYSDIMGNLCEMLCNETDDRSWLVAERSGAVMRDMGNPNSCGQPEYVGDQYYSSSVLMPVFEINDYGGVHGNNSLIGHMAYLLDRAGMSMDEQFSMWSTSIELLTPMSNYTDLHGALLFALKINGMLQKYGPTLNKAFADAGLNDDWTTSYLEATRDGCGRVNIQTDAYIAGKASLILFAEPGSGNVLGRAYPDQNGIASALLKAGSYWAQMQLRDGNETVIYNYNGSAWVKNGQLGAFSIRAGAKTNLAAVSSGKTPSGGSGTGGQTSGETLNLIPFNGGYFSMLVPEGWRMEVNGEYGAFSVKLFDPYNPSMQVFYYGALAPFHKSEQTRRVLSQYDNTGGLVAYGPVLTEASVKGVTDNWQYCIEYQKYFDGKQLFTTLENIKMACATNYNGPNAGTNAIDSVGAATCNTADGTTCIFVIATSLVDLDYNNNWKGNWFYTAFDTVGVLCPFDDFDAYYADLLKCIASLQFSQDYIDASQSTGSPMSENEVISDCLEVITDAMTALYLYVR